MRSVYCPYCCNVYPLRGVLFRCLKDLGCDPFSADGRKRSQDCPQGHEAFERTCPGCKKDLPTRYCHGNQFVIVVVGAKESGKSTFLTVLIRNLQKRLCRELRASLYFGDTETENRFRGPHSRLYETGFILDTTPATGPKQAGKPLIFRLERTAERAGVRAAIHAGDSFVFYDVAGEDFQNRESAERIARYLQAAGGILLLVDPREFPASRADVEYQPESTFPVGGPSPEAILGYVTNLIRGGPSTERLGRLTVPVAAVLSKIDILAPWTREQSVMHRPRLRDGRLHLTDRAAVHEQVRALLNLWESGLEDALSNNYTDYGFFAVSALGAAPSAGRVEAAGIRPHRVEDPFLWLLNRFRIVASTEDV